MVCSLSIVFQWKVLQHPFATVFVVVVRVVVLTCTRSARLFGMLVLIGGSTLELFGKPSYR
jgi:hypothetical protein